jgi:hypothetical protein
MEFAHQTGVGRPTGTATHHVIGLYRRHIDGKGARRHQPPPRQVGADIKQH